MKRVFLRFSLSFFGLIFVTLITGQSAHAYSNSHLMDDAIFDNVGSMSEQQIRDFINARPNTCLTRVGPGLGGGDIFPEPITYWQYGANVDAARVIYKSAIYNDINPQVIISTLQKEQSLFTDNDCLDQNGVDRLNKAMGQGCPDGGQCPAPAYAGFHQQVMKGSWQLKFNKERANGNVEWGANGSIVYGMPYTEGNRKACSTCADIYRDGYWTIDGQAVKMETGATASLYRYTPHLGQAFPGIFEGWFGSTLNPTNPPLMVWRLIHPSRGVHFYTISVAERNVAINQLGFKLEGAAFIGYPEAKVGMVPVYRLYSPGGGYHFFTANAEETQIVTQQLGYKFEGIAFYAPSDMSAPNTQSVTRLLQPKTGEHFLTTSNEERIYLAAHGWKSEGVAFLGL